MRFVWAMVMVVSCCISEKENEIYEAVRDRMSAYVSVQALTLSIEKQKTESPRDKKGLYTARPLVGLGVTEYVLRGHDTLRWRMVPHAQQAQILA